MKLIEKIQANMEESEKKAKSIAATLQDLSKESQEENSYKPPTLQDINDEENGEVEIRKEKELDKNAPQIYQCADRIERLLKESSVVNNYFNDYVSLLQS